LLFANIIIFLNYPSSSITTISSKEVNTAVFPEAKEKGPLLDFFFLSKVTGIILLVFTIKPLLHEAVVENYSTLFLQSLSV